MAKVNPEIFGKEVHTLMADTINKTVKDNSLDGVFTEVPHDEKLGLRVPERIRLFYLVV